MRWPFQKKAKVEAPPPRTVVNLDPRPDSMQRRKKLLTIDVSLGDFGADTGSLNVGTWTLRRSEYIKMMNSMHVGTNHEVIDTVLTELPTLENKRGKPGTWGIMLKASPCWDRLSKESREGEARKIEIAIRCYLNGKQVGTLRVTPRIWKHMKQSAQGKRFQFMMCLEERFKK